jgi:LysR family transcriptional regulator, transcriptional activator of the cysJI operon
LIDVRLNTFMTVAKIKSFTRAGEILNLTQPAVSQHIKHLEEYYCVSLFKKQGKDMDMTEEGRILYEYAQKIEILHRDLEGILRNRSGIHRIYNVGASMTIGGYVLPPILALYKKAYKNTDIILQVNNTEEIIDKLLNRKIDFALVEGNFDKNKFFYKRFKTDKMVLAVSSLHDFAQRVEVSINEVIKGPLILREKGSGTREVFEDALNKLGFDVQEFKPYMEIGSISAIKSLVEENLGYTVISGETIKKELRTGAIKAVPIKEIEFEREFNFVYIEGVINMN